MCSRTWAGHAKLAGSIVAEKVQSKGLYTQYPIEGRFVGYSTTANRLPMSWKLQREPSARISGLYLSRSFEIGITTARGSNRDDDFRWRGCESDSFSTSEPD